MSHGTGVFGIQLISPNRIYLLAVVALVAVAFATVASLFGRYSYLELATHFRLQYALASSLCVLLLIAFHSWRLLPLALCCAVFNWAYILPYYSAAAHPKAPASAVHLRLMLANVLGSNKNYAALTRAIAEERPDIAVLQEFTAEWQGNLESLNVEFPYSKVVARPGGSGMALFSKYPLEGVEVLALDTSTHLAILAKLNVAGTPLTVLSLHPPTPVRSGKFSNRNEQFARAAAIMKATTGAKLLVGDLNTTMWSPYFTDLVRESGLRDAHVGFGIRPSWPVPLPAIFQIPIDQCLIGDGMVVEAMRTGRRTGSDHRPLFVDVTFAR